MIFYHLVLMTIILWCLSPLAWAGRYWVSLLGNDANGCIPSDTQPADLANNARATPLQGDACLGQPGGPHRVTILAGTYTGPNARLDIANSGVSGNHHIVEGDPSSSPTCAKTSTCPTILVPDSSVVWGVVLTGSYITIRNLDVNSQNTISYAMRLGTSDAVTYTQHLIENVELRNSPASGIFVHTTTSFWTLRGMNSHDNGTDGFDHGGYLSGDDGLIENSWFHHNDGNGIQCYNSTDDQADRCTVRFSRFNNNGADGFVLEGDDDLAYANETYGNAFSGILCMRARNKVFNNLIYGNGTLGFSTSGTGCDDLQFKNNIVTENGSTEVQIAPGNTGAVLSNNACGASESCGTTGKVTITSILDCVVSLTDFRLKAGAPCIDTGLTLPEASIDFLGVSRPQGAAYDIGAYEFVDVDVTPPSIPTGVRVD